MSGDPCRMGGKPTFPRVGRAMIPGMRWSTRNLCMNYSVKSTKPPGFNRHLARLLRVSAEVVLSLSLAKVTRGERWRARIFNQLRTAFCLH